MNNIDMKKRGRPLGSKSRKIEGEEKKPYKPRKKRLPTDEEGINRRLEHIRGLTRARRAKHAKKICLCVCGREYIDPSSRRRHEATKVHQRLMSETE